MIFATLNEIIGSGNNNHQWTLKPLEEMMKNWLFAWYQNITKELTKSLNNRDIWLSPP